MDDGDGAFTAEMLASQQGSEILSTIYNGSKMCGCGALINPVTAMYTDNLCPNCITRASAKRANSMMGR